MGFSQTDLQNIESALVDLASNKQIVRVSVMGQTIEYGQGDINALLTLKKEIQTALRKKPKVVIVSTSKGL